MKQLKGEARKKLEAERVRWDKHCKDLPYFIELSTSPIGTVWSGALWKSNRGWRLVKNGEEDFTCTW